MSANSKIEWCDRTWNPITGCSKVSPGCARCYAESIARRFDPAWKPWIPANASENVRLHSERLDLPMRWRKPQRVFVNSMSDLFHEAVPGRFINEVWMAMFNTPRHTYQILTKRPERLLRWTEMAAQAKGWPVQDIWPDWIWLGVSVENQRWADERIALLLQTPAVVRFLSIEPLLGPIDLNTACWGEGMPLPPLDIQARQVEPNGQGWSHGFTPLRAIDWVICGAESGPKARPMDEDWVRQIRDDCQAAGVPFLYKQAIRQGKKVSMPELDGRVWAEFPKGETR